MTLKISALFPICCPAPTHTSFLPPQRCRENQGHKKQHFHQNKLLWVFFLSLSLHSSPFASVLSVIYIHIANCTLGNKEGEERWELRSPAICVHPGWMGTCPRDSSSCPASTGPKTLLRASILCLQSKSHLPAPQPQPWGITSTQAMCMDYSQFYSRANEIPSTARPVNRPVKNALGRREL